MKTVYTCLFFCFFAVLWSGNSFSQLIPHNDQKIIDAVDSNMYYRNELTGYRIQLAFDSEKSTIDSLRIKFATVYPKIETYVTFEAPYFNFMVGDFRTEIEAEEFKRKIIGGYPLTVIHRTKIKLPRID